MLRVNLAKLAGATAIFSTMKFPSSGPWLALLPFFTVIAFCYATGEFYPFSKFPMYSKFEEKTYIVYLTDRTGKPVPTLDFGIFASDLKKHYGDGLDELKKDLKGSHYTWTAEQKAPAAREALRFLRDERAPQAFTDGRNAHLTLMDVRIYWKDGHLAKVEEPVASLDQITAKSTNP